MVIQLRYTDLSQSNYSMKCKLSSYVVKHNLTTLKYNNISQVCPYKDLGSAKDYVIILLFLMQPSAGDKPDRMQSQEKHNPIYYAQVKTDYESTWQMQLQVPTGAHLLETVTKLEVSRANTGAIPRQA